MIPGGAPLIRTTVFDQTIGTYFLKILRNALSFEESSCVLSTAACGIDVVVVSVDFVEPATDRAVEESLVSVEPPLEDAAMSDSLS